MKIRVFTILFSLLAIALIGCGATPEVRSQSVSSSVNDEKIGNTELKALNQEVKTSTEEFLAKHALQIEYSIGIDNRTSRVLVIFPPGDELRADSVLAITDLRIKLEALVNDFVDREELTVKPADILEFREAVMQPPE